MGDKILDNWIMETNTTVREYLHALNVIDEGRDLYVDGIDGIAVDPPICLTQEGEERFKNVLDSKTLYVEEGTICSTDDNDYEENEDSLLLEAYYLLRCLAGYCSVGKFDKWIENGNPI